MPVLTLPDLRINYLSLGERQHPELPPIVLVHGLGASLGFWYLQIAPKLAQHRRVILLDLRGHGRSSMPAAGYTPAVMADDLLALLDHLRIASVHLLGHSYGGMVALEFAWRNPHRIATLTIADSRMRSVQPTIDMAQWPSGKRYLQYLQSVGIELHEDAADIAIDIFEQLARLRLDRPEAMDRLQEHLPSPFGGSTGDVAARRWLELLNVTAARSDFQHGEDVPLEEFAASGIQTHLLFGEYSQALPSAHAIKRVCSDATLEILPGAGHFFPLSKPEAVIGHLLNVTRADAAPVLVASQ